MYIYNRRKVRKETPHHSLQEVPITTFIRILFVTCLVPGLSVPLPAGQDQDAEGSQDHPLISRYPGSFIKAYLTKEFDEFTFPPGKLANANTFTKSQHLEGKITRIVYVGPAGRSVVEVYRNDQGALKKAGFETLFSCGPQDCGGFGSASPRAYGSGEYEDCWGPDDGIH